MNINLLSSILKLPGGLWSLLVWLLLGALIGWVAAILFGSKGGLIKYMIIGIVGSYIGGFIASLIKGVNNNGFMGVLFAVLGSGILIVILKAFKIIK